jgi:formylglycine-generating enzyme required for sulfatase activity
MRLVGTHTGEADEFNLGGGLMERRKFLQGSAAGLGTFVANRGLESLHAGPTESLGETAPAGSPSAKLVEVPTTGYVATDSLTTVPINVTLGKFLISPTEITQHEFEAVMGYDPSFHKGPELPVESVSWWEAIRYCNLRSTRENLEPCYHLESGYCDLRKNGYRLPTEAEWSIASGGEFASPFESPAPWPVKTSASRDAAHGESAYPLDSGWANLGSSDTTHVDLLMRELETSGTKPVGSYRPNRYGLYDMIGNVWEWCNDYFDPVPTPQCSYNPAGPSRGLARVVRGGSFISTTSNWARGYRSCMEPGYKSRFTGFRVCRTAEPMGLFPPLPQDPKWFEPYYQPPPGYDSTIGNLSPLVSGQTTASEWEDQRSTIKAKWLRLLGAMEISPPPPKTQLVETVKDQNFTGKLMYLQVESDWWEKILVMMPSEPLTRPRPVVIVPFYDVDDPVGRDLSGRKFFGGGVRGFARLAVQRGYIAVAIRWFGESYGESYNEAVANLKLRHPQCTGLGKWVWDVQRLLDYLYTLPEVDHQHVGIIGHSLGGKMALYAGAFDDRSA